VPQPHERIHRSVLQRCDFLVLDNRLIRPRADYVGAMNRRWVSVRRHWLGVRAFQAGMTPVTVGLLLATGWHLMPPLDGQPRAWALAVAVALLVWRTRIRLIWLVLAGAVLGALGVV